MTRSGFGFKFWSSDMLFEGKTYIAIRNPHTEFAGLYLITRNCDNGFLLYLLSVIVRCHLSNLGCTA
jgi:hypothetical protein